MVFRRRYQVVMVGDSALTAAQRSVLSEHRTEEEARAAAAAERRRLEVVRPDDARAWRLQVLRDGEIVHEERPHPEEVPPVLGRTPGRGADPPADALGASPPADAPGASPPAAGGSAAGEAGGAETPGAPVGRTAEATGDAGEAGQRGVERAPAEEPPPEGPVPDWVIRRFEEAVERERRRGGRGEDPDGA